MWIHTKFGKMNVTKGRITELNSQFYYRTEARLVGFPTICLGYSITRIKEKTKKEIERTAKKAAQKAVKRAVNALVKMAEVVRTKRGDVEG